MRDREKREREREREREYNTTPYSGGVCVGGWVRVLCVFVVYYTCRARDSTVNEKMIHCKPHNLLRGFTVDHYYMY